MAEKFSKRDAADHLDDIATYLQVALADSAEDPAILPIALGTIARARNFSELAREGRHDPRRSLQGALRGWQSELCDRGESDARAGLRLELHAVA